MSRTNARIRLSIDGVRILFTTGALVFATACSGQTQAPTPLAHVSERVLNTCAGCHGASGEGNANGAPRLAGQNPEYLAHALLLFKSGKRSNAVMQAVARTLSDSDIKEIARFYASQHPPFAQPISPPPTSVISAGRQLAESGTNTVPACFSCHGTTGQGNGMKVPGIAGQPAGFLIARLHEFQTRAQKATPKPGSMTAVSAAMSDDQIREVAAYLSGAKP